MKTILFTTALLFTVILSDAQQVPDNTGSSVSQDDAQKALDFHNKARKDVGAPALEWSPELAAFAQAWANHIAENCKMEHRSRSGDNASSYGENIFSGGGANYTVLDASQAWYNEIQKYTYGPVTQDNWAIAGHYTQMVWSASIKTGMGTATCANGDIMIVANYDPPGNMMGGKPY